MELKKILFICPAFNSYEIDIYSALKMNGYEVDFITYNEEKVFGIGKIKYAMLILVRLFFYLMLKDYKKSKIYSKIENYIYLIQHDKFQSFILKEIGKYPRKHYNYLLVVKGFGFSNEMILKLRARCDNAIIYQWDPLLRYPSILKTYKAYDKVISFQSTDLKSYPSSFFLPTFFKDYGSLMFSDAYESDLCFVGAFTFGRYLKLKRINKECQKNGLRCNFKLVSNNFFLKFFIDRNYLNLGRIERKYVKSIYSKSKVIVDLAHSGQEGITQRVFEALSLGRGVYSDTHDIDVVCHKHEKIRSYIFNKDNISSIKNFYPSLDESIEIKNEIRNYEITNWVVEVLKI